MYFTDICPCRYFGNYGIIRDIVHSHILQTIALFAMESPVSLDGEDIRDEKVRQYNLLTLLSYKLENADLYLFIYVGEGAQINSESGP